MVKFDERTLMKMREN